MKYLLSLLAGLVTLASPARGQVFRLPDTSACQKSKLLCLCRPLPASHPGCGQNFYIETTEISQILTF